MFKNHLSYLFAFFLLSSCGGGGDNNSNNQPTPQQQEQEPEPDVLQRAFRADLRPVNPTVAEDLEGLSIVRLQGDNFQVNVAVQKIPGTIHHQHIQLGDKCPTAAADTNKDGFIDRVEAEAASGPTFIPLDEDLDNNAEDARGYPRSDILESYVYQQAASRSRLLSELGPGAVFAIDTRVIMIFGTDESEDFPDTVASPNGRPVQETLPVACGQFFQVVGS